MSLLERLSRPLARLDAELAERLAKAPLRLNEYGDDFYGFHPDRARRILLGSALLYRHYFRAEAHGIAQFRADGCCWWPTTPASSPTTAPC